MRWAFMKYIVLLGLDWSRGVVSRSWGGAEKSNSARMTFPCLEEEQQCRVINVTLAIEHKQPK